MKDFFNYYRAVHVGNVRYSKRSGWSLELFFIIVSGLLVAGATACFNHNVGISETETYYSGNFCIYFSTFIYVMALSMGMTRRFKPSALNLVPFSYKKRAVFSHFAVLLSGLLFIAMWFAIMLAVILFVSFITLIFTGEWVFLPDFEQKAGLVLYPNWQGVLFAIFLCLALFGSGMAISYIKNKKIRYSMLFVCPVVHCIFAVFMANMATPDSKFVISCNMLFNFKNLPLSPVWLAAVAVIAIGICAVSLCLAFKYEKPKAY